MVQGSTCNIGSMSTSLAVLSAVDLKTVEGGTWCVVSVCGFWKILQFHGDLIYIGKKIDDDDNAKIGMMMIIQKDRLLGSRAKTDRSMKRKKKSKQKKELIPTPSPYPSPHTPPYKTDT